jgi:hypothetical protein
MRELLRHIGFEETRYGREVKFTEMKTKTAYYMFMEVAGNLEFLGNSQG